MPPQQESQACVQCFNFNGVSFTGEIEMRSQMLALLLALSAMFVSQAQASYMSSVLSNNPVGYYQMNETSGTTAVDSSWQATPASTTTDPPWGKLDLGRPVTQALPPTMPQ
jgi:hypothetical protein